MVMTACIFALMLLGFAWLLSWAKERQTNVRDFRLPEVERDGTVSDERMLWEYPCGLRAGDVLRLRHDRQLRVDREGTSAQVQPAGERNVVLPGNPDEADAIWLERPGGEPITIESSDLDAFDLSDQHDPRFP
jgi:hypothetical protein